MGREFCIENLKGENMKAVIRLDVPEWQIGSEVTVYFKDTMREKGVCEKESENKETKQEESHSVCKSNKLEESFIELGVEIGFLTREKAEWLLEGLRNQFPQIVRCKNCKHMLPKGYCHKHSKRIMNDEWFCADGKGKTE